MLTPRNGSRLTAIYEFSISKPKIVNLEGGKWNFLKLNIPKLLELKIGLGVRDEVEASLG